METVLLALCGSSAVGALALAVLFLVTHAPDLVTRLLACLLLLDQSVITILFLRLPVAVPPLRLAVRIGAIGISLAGVLLFVWNAIPRPGRVDVIVPIVGAAMVVQGLLTWRYLATRNDGITGSSGPSH